MRDTFVATMFFLLLLIIICFNSCHIGRFVIYNFANINDYKKFQNRDILPGNSVFKFKKTPNIKVFKRALGSSEHKEIRNLDSVLNRSNTVAFLIIRNDTILFEWYSPKNNDSSQFTSFSMAKSYVSAMIGIAINERKIANVNEPITNYLKELKDPRFEKVTIEHLLNMRTGFDYKENYNSPFGNVAVSYYGRNLERHLEKLRIKKEPDLNFEYVSIATQILGVILEKATGTTLSEYCEIKLWKPLGMEFPASWSLDRKNGTEKAFCCLNARAIDYAKFGRLFLNKGNWDGEQIISKDWVKKSTIKSSNSKDLFYGYHWWHDGMPNNDGQVNFFAQGHLGQFTYMNPQKNTIIVRLGKNHGLVKWKSLINEINNCL